MGPTDVNFTQCYFLHEELLLKVNCIIDQKGSETSDLMICHILKLF